MIPKECKRLAEVDFPIAEVSKHAVTGEVHQTGAIPLLIHLWWARRPLGIVPGRSDGPAAARPV